MKRVSFEIAKALKEVGYPIEVKTIEEAEKLGWKKGEAFFTGMCTCALSPYAMEVWLWLWREKKYAITLECIDNKDWATGKIGFFGDPEDAIIAEIQHIVDCKQ